ncbi:protein-glutamate O-methyltransferase CheR [Acuticoccus sp. I52.16.1]|uniref:CheR family methyltransferase n=1 Tax=Acuticoccus sp. I52.16.1 TaxID=2928472 RepID=UPI001FD62362|nr:protein-glutamate O-methyltransferase CheR [Acuticoccus sp. I52.16.1]UOM35699.1 protein-glutamate O-methyltransferase CheR [Acuticoccus sp. I52.16.1]
MVRDDDFSFLRRILKERSGLALSADKQYLVTTRLKPICEAHGFKDLTELVNAMRGARGREITEEVVDAMTTNESLFFRDQAPFDALIGEMLPRLIAARGGKPIRIWSAAASTGQEPYSIAILLEENQKKFGRQPVEIIATDISQAALARARAGEYTQFEVGRGMPQQYLSRYFTRGERNHYLIAPTIKKRVTFQPRNLLEPFDRLGQFDIIFCRNVLIYFDRPTKSNVLERMARLMPQDGYLILGGPETTLGLTPQFARHGDLRNVYVRASAEAAQARNVA